MTLTIAALWSPDQAPAQGVTGPIVSDSKVGYIDSAVPGNVFRFRYDSAWNNRRPSRGEFFYAQNAPGGPGLPKAESSVDYQDVTAYAEAAFLPQFSAFLEVPTRFLNPDINNNTAGLGDMNAGVKYAILANETRLLTFQFRTYVPTADAHRGLGTRHVSLEPALLYYKSLGQRAAVEGELRYWVPVGGTNFAGDMFRYGIGASYLLYDNCRFRVTPVAEMVAWTLLDGQESFLPPSGIPQTHSAAGDTIVNFKLGVRFGILDHTDIYAGWGRPVTGDRWYENTFRMELRVLF